MLKSADEFSDVRFCIADMKKLLDLANMSGLHICERAGCSQVTEAVGQPSGTA